MWNKKMASPNYVNFMLSALALWSQHPSMHIYTAFCFRHSGSCLQNLFYSLIFSGRRDRWCDSPCILYRLNSHSPNRSKARAYYAPSEAHREERERDGRGENSKRVHSRVQKALLRLCVSGEAFIFIWTCAHTCCKIVCDKNAQRLLLLIVALFSRTWNSSVFEFSDTQGAKLN